MLPLLNNVNNEEYSNIKDEVATMMHAVSKISDAVTHYASHQLRANPGPQKNSFKDEILQGTG